MHLFSKQLVMRRSVHIDLRAVKRKHTHTCNFNHRTAHANYQDQTSFSSHGHFILEVHKPYHLYANDMSHNHIWSPITTNMHCASPVCSKNCFQEICPRIPRALDNGYVFRLWDGIEKECIWHPTRSNGSTQLVCL